MWRKPSCTTRWRSRPQPTSPPSTAAILLRRCDELSIARQDRVLQDRIDLVFPALAAEYPLMADAGLHVVALEIGSQPAAQVVRRDRLADGADVVALALDGEQH